MDVLRTLRLGAYGLLVDGPVGSLWYEVLERYVWPKEPTSTKAVLAKTALDQVVYATIMTGAVGAGAACAGPWRCAARGSTLRTLARAAAAAADPRLCNPAPAPCLPAADAPGAAVYFALIRLMEGAPDTIWATLQAKFLPTLAANYMIWPLAHLINFKYVPSQYRILYNNVVCIGWLTGLSLLTHSKINFASLLHLSGGH